MKDKYDVIIVGGGVAGLYAALNLDDSTEVLLMVKREITLSNSSLAQGGVASVLDLTNDDYESHIRDTMIAGGNANDPEAVRTLVTEGPQDVMRLYELGVDFDRSGDGLQMTLEGGHSRHRIVHHKDSTGKAIVDTLIEIVKAKKNITIIENTLLCSLQRAENGFFAHVMSPEGYSIISSPYVILATGGIGRVYKYTTNSAIATGDGIALAYELGARIKHLDYVQFHPTALAAHERERLLISEAVRGEGALLLNCDGNRFMDRYDDRLELAPRDVVSRSIILESRRTGSENFYLDITHKGAEFLKQRFPMIYSRCLEAGIDMTKEWIPIFPCQHYLMGGIDVDLHARTSISRLYAAGECSHTGVHGKNRLASNSLLEALVFGRRAAQDINSRQGFGEVSGRPVKMNTNGAPLPTGLRTTIRQIMQLSYFVIPDKDKAEQGLRQIEDMYARLHSGKFAVTRDFIEAKSLCSVARIILKEVISK